MKIKKVIGIGLYRVVGIWMPGKLGKGIRYFCAKLMLDYCGKKVNICRKSIFSTKVSIGNNSGIGENCRIQGRCFIGKNVLMGPEVNIWCRNHKTSNIDIPIIQQGLEDEKPVHIGDDVWIGSRVIILPGIKIGNGVVIGAGSVVSKDIPDYSVAVGNPVRIVKNRKNNI